VKSTNDLNKEVLDHFNQCTCEACQLMVDYGTWRHAYARGYRVARFPVPTVWRHPRFIGSFDFYVQRGYVNAMYDAAIARHEDASSSD